jgi:hypothetical protein
MNRYDLLDQPAEMAPAADGEWVRYEDARYLLSALYEAADALDNYSDVNDGDDGQPVANRAMSALRDVEAAIAKAEGM